MRYNPEGDDFFVTFDNGKEKWIAHETIHWID
jgi:hypothetical protein